MMSHGSNLRHMFATLLVAGLFAVMGFGHDLLLAAHAAHDHSRISACEEHDRGGAEDRSPDKPSKEDDCGICHALVHAQSFKGGMPYGIERLIVEQSVAVTRVAMIDVRSAELRHSRARGPPTRSR